MHLHSDDRWHEDHGWPDRAIAALADRQRTMVTTAQLRELGVGRGAVARARSRGRLHPVHHGVHSLVLPRSRPPLAAEQAALLAVGADAVLSHFSAGLVGGLRFPFAIADVHVTTTGAHRRSQRGIVVHRTTTLHPTEAFPVHGLRATSVARTLVDLAPYLSDAKLEPLLDQALRRTSTAKITEALHRHPRRPGVTRLWALLDPDRPSADSWSRDEARLRRSIIDAGLPAPESNQPVGRGYIADLLWREPRLIVEYDSRTYHDQPGVFDRDRSRHNDLEAHAGHRVLHVTRRQLRHELPRVLVWIALALADRPGVG